MKLEIERRIRWYQRPLHEHLVTQPRARAIEIAHRRWGKDEVTLVATCELALRRPGSYWHCLPEYEQARKALWTAVNPSTGRRRIDEAFPPELRATKDEQQMFIRLKNGSTWQLVGSDRYDSLVGAGVAGVVFSEWALANPSAWGFIRPMIEENNGWAVFITTPRGRNHAKAMYDMARANPDRWFSEISTINNTHALSAEQVAEAKAEYVALYGEDVGRAQFEQEYLCSFNAAVLGAFYASEMAAVHADGRIRDFDPAPGLVHRAWDIGTRDDTSIWWFQVIAGVPHFIDCYTSHGAGIEHYAQVCAERGWPQGIDYVPHDAKVVEWGTGRTRIESMQMFGLNPRLVPGASKLDGINAARLTLKSAVFHTRCEDTGVAALEQYRREWDDERKMFAASEVRDWTTHLADAFRYAALSWREVPAAKPEREFFTDPAGNKKPVLQRPKVLTEMTYDEVFPLDGGPRRKIDRI